jgi:hypothetical protein
MFAPRFSTLRRLRRNENWKDGKPAAAARLSGFFESLKSMDPDDTPYDLAVVCQRDGFIMRRVITQGLVYI